MRNSKTGNERTDRAPHGSLKARLRVLGIKYSDSPVLSDSYLQFTIRNEGILPVCSAVVPDYPYEEVYPDTGRKGRRPLKAGLFWNLSTSPSPKRYTVPSYSAGLCSLMPVN